MKFQLSYFKIQKGDAVKVLHSIYQQIWKTQQLPWDWKRSVFIPIPKKGNAKECSNYLTIALISNASKVMLKIVQARLLQYVNWELPDVQAGFGKGTGTRDQIGSIHWIIEKAKGFHKNIYCFIDYTKAFDCVVASTSSLDDKEMGEKWEQWQIFFTWAQKSLWTVPASTKLKGAPWKESYNKPR